MPPPITHYSGASFDYGPAPQSQTEAETEATGETQAAEETQVTVEVELSGTTADGDTVEISSSDDASGESAASGNLIGTYGPPKFSNRFQFDIANGMFDRSLRFTPLKPRFNGAAAATYEARQSLDTQVSNTAGQGSVYSALFDVQYNEAQPDASKAGSSVDARTELSRIADRNLTLLSQL